MDAWQRSIVAFAVIVAGLMVAGCQTNEEYGASIDGDFDSRLARFNGSTMATFSAQTGLLPSNAYPIASGRVFVIDGTPVYVTLPATHVTPAVTRSSACRLMITTSQVGETRTADDWQIVGIKHSGPCHLLSV